MTFVLPGSIRSKKNSKRIFARGNVKRVLPSRAYLEWEQTARAAVRREYAWPPLTCQVHVMAQIYYKGPRPDLSGALESVGDCLEGIVYENDSQIYSWDGSRLYPDKDNPRTIVTISALKAP